MITTYMVDTDTFSYIASGRSQAARSEFRRLAEDPDAQLCISVMTEAEVRFGIARRALATARRAAIEGLFANFEILPFGSGEAAIYGDALAKLRSQGIGVSLFDLLIAVHAASTNSVLVTHDQIFPEIAGVVGIPATVDWATDL